MTTDRGQAAGTQGGAVLVVDDDPELRTMIVDVLRAWSIPAIEATDGSEALDQVATAMPGLILLDLRMRGVDGWAFTRQFRARFGRAAPIVVITAAADAQDWARGVGADDMLAKPFSIRALIGVVRKYLGGVGADLGR
jgi:CheY-like chemotaxis protein